MITKEKERQWQAEQDAPTLASYQEIISDKARMTRATKVAKQLATDLTKRATAMQHAAGTKTGTSAKTNTNAKSGKGRK